MQMNKNLLIDKRSIMQVLGGLLLDTNLLARTDKYHFNEEDFDNDFYVTIYAAITNLKTQGLKKINAIDIDNFLSTRPQLYKIFNDKKGIEYINEILEISDLTKFDTYYSRMKKMTLLRMYNSFGIDISWLYNPSVLDVKKKEEQEDWLDSSDISFIADAIDKRIEEIKSKYLNSIGDNGSQAGENIFELIARLKETPEVGIPLYGNLLNSATRGARLKKLYLRSAPTGVGKTRMMIADVCGFAVSEIYDLYLQKWIPNGTSEPSLFITTEQELDEVQTMMLAFLSGVDEEKILDGSYSPEELERVMYAAKLISEAPLWVEELPDFSLTDIENTIRKHVIDNDVRYVAFDYIHTSMKILEEITKRSGGVKLREDNILFMLAIRLKDLCNQMGIFIMTATQLNGEWEDRKDGNQNLLRGSKAIADKIDFGCIVLPVTDTDLKSLETLLSVGSLVQPSIVYHIYKNRRSKYKSVKLWCAADLGICRVTPIFATDNNYKLIPMQELEIIVKESDDL